MNINDLVRTIKQAFGVKDVSENDLKEVKRLIKKYKKDGLPVDKSAIKAIQEVFGKKSLKKLERAEFIKAFDLSWFGSNSDSLEQAIDQYFKEKED